MDVRALAVNQIQQGKTPRLVLWLGFGGLLACIAAGAVGTILSLDHVQLMAERSDLRTANRPECRIRSRRLPRVARYDPEGTMSRSAGDPNPYA